MEAGTHAGLRGWRRGGVVKSRLLQSADLLLLLLARTVRPPGHNSDAVFKMANPRVYFDITIDGAAAGKITMELNADVVPKTAGKYQGTGQMN
ncbi:hypothetical protein CRUP_010184 [Coryphaenoides rupestris]|nr:hypothetical protein CRUP_010184 [Coryphaenoides rupestris]